LLVRRRIVLAANSLWNIVNFRAGLIRALKEAGYEPVVIAPPDAAAERRFAELGVEHVPIRIERAGLNPFADFRLFRTYRSLLKRLRPAAFLGFTIKPNIYGSLAAKSLKIPAIPNVSGLGTAFIRGGALEVLVSRLYRAAFRSLETVFFQNPDDRALFVGRGIVTPAQAKLIPGSGIDLKQFVPAPLPAGPVVFLLIARLLGDKGIREYVSAARELRGQFADVWFQLLGLLDEENPAAILRHELEHWIADGAIEYLGGADDVRPCIARASVIVLPSYREGMPRSLLEAAAMGRPLIATDVPGCRQLVVDGRTGFLCAVRDSTSLADTMRRMMQTSHHERAAMGQAARAKVENEFAEGLVIRAYLEALEPIEGTRS
jgi:glycosyltransferase involved in cell wall biosynthesis